MTSIPPIARRAIALGVVPAASVCILTGWAALDSAAFAYRVIRNRR